jgi:hypothetical protein
MRFIQKGNEPPSFSVWKQQSIDDCPSTWENFRKPQKPEVLDSLLQEQGFICCYCGQVIDRKHSHIEHFQPRTHYPSLSVDYSNLLACCPMVRMIGIRLLKSFVVIIKKIRNFLYHPWMKIAAPIFGTAHLVRSSLAWNHQSNFLRKKRSPSLA